MDLYIIRHGQTEYNVRHIFQGRADIPLNENGLKQAEELAEKFEDIPLDVILCSPLTRAIETAEPLAKMKQLDIMIEPDLIERSFGDMEGLPPLEEFNIQLLTAWDPIYQGHGAEPIDKLIQRAERIIKNVKEKYRGQKVVICSHGNTTGAMIYCLNGKPENTTILDLSLQNGEIKHYQIEEKQKPENDIEEERF